jgi:hypothetical protein
VRNRSPAPDGVMLAIASWMVFTLAQPEISTVAEQ